MHTHKCTMHSSNDEGESQYLNSEIIYERKVKEWFWIKGKKSSIMYGVMEYGEKSMEWIMLLIGSGYICVHSRFSYLQVHSTIL